MAGGDDKARIERSRQGARARAARADKDTRRGGELAGIVSASPIPPFASGFTVNDCGHLTPSMHQHLWIFKLTPLIFASFINLLPLESLLILNPEPAISWPKPHVNKDQLHIFPIIDFTDWGPR